MKTGLISSENYDDSDLTPTFLRAQALGAQAPILAAFDSRTKENKSPPSQISATSLGWDRCYWLFMNHLLLP